MVYNIPFDMQKHYGYQREALHYYGAIKFNETAASCNLLHAMLCLSHCIKASITTKETEQMPLKVFDLLMVIFEYLYGVSL